VFAVGSYPRTSHRAVERGRAVEYFVSLGARSNSPVRP